ncbi:hypothetical protein BZL30_7288 [Mycobacterium kansasii]|uniref:Uncharacterized protein n=1 Tax=Mycobacterium kansasii TaxID=1768 RepID=A0A1V3WQX0_MYCKA|nr:hypothetical protein BZL30_7288 [Mycobacterium kansasii]OOK69906.1 hypothetical protein BZL29_6395 [Mycobacterium kansasii]
MPDLVGGQADAVRGVHGVVHVGDQLRQIGWQRSIGAHRYRLRRSVQDRIAHDANRYHCHGRLA